MTARKNTDPPGMPAGLEEQVQKKAARRRWARARKKRTVWFGFGMFGLIGWAVAIPTVLGILLGIWLDRHWPTDQISWTLSLLFVGIFLGCINAWRWVSRERRVESRPDSRSDAPLDNRDKTRKK